MEKTQRIDIRVSPDQKRAILKAVADHPKQRHWRPYTLSQYLLDLHYAEEVRKLQEPLPDVEATSPRGS